MSESYEMIRVIEIDPDECLDQYPVNIFAVAIAEGFYSAMGILDEDSRGITYGRVEVEDWENEMLVLDDEDLYWITDIQSPESASLYEVAFDLDQTIDDLLSTDQFIPFGE